MPAPVRPRPKVPKRHLTLTVPAHDTLTAARDQLAEETGDELSFSDTVQIMAKRAGLGEGK